MVVIKIYQQMLRQLKLWYLYSIWAVDTTVSVASQLVAKTHYCYVHCVGYSGSYSSVDCHCILSEWPTPLHISPWRPQTNLAPGLLWYFNFSVLSVSRIIVCVCVLLCVCVWCVYCVYRWWFASSDVNPFLLTFKNWKLNFTYARLPDKEFKWYLLNIFVLFGIIYAVQAIMLYK